MNTKAEEAFRKENQLQGVNSAAKDLGAELRELSDEELDKVAGGKPDHNACPLNCSFSILKNRCIC